MSAPVLVPDTDTGDLFGDAPVAPLEAVAAQINQAHADAQAHASKAVERALVAGDLLNTVKAQLRHGEFLPWCKEHCPAISQRTIQDYTRVARELPIEMRSAAHLSLREALRTLTADRQLLKIPDEHAGWYDLAADAVWSKTSHAHAFRFSVFDPDVKKALATDQILPLATTIRDELEQAEQATGQECLTDAGIRAAVRRQFQPVLKIHQAETKQAERADPSLRLNTLVRNGLTALEQSKSALNQITILAERGAITDPNFGAMGDRFYRATQEVKKALEEFPTAARPARSIDPPPPDPQGAELCRDSNLDFLPDQQTADLGSKADLAFPKSTDDIDDDPDFAAAQTRAMNIINPLFLAPRRGRAIGEMICGLSDAVDGVGIATAADLDSATQIIAALGDMVYFAKKRMAEQAA